MKNKAAYQAIKAISGAARSLCSATIIANTTIGKFMSISFMVFDVMEY